MPRGHGAGGARLDAASVKSLLPEPDRHPARFHDCFSRREQRDSLRVCVRGQLSDLERKSVEPIALEFGVPPRNVRPFLSRAGWDHDMARARTQQIIRYHQRHIRDAAAAHAKKRKERLRAAGVAPEIITSSERKVAL